ncbi:replication-relaxation family protein [Kitasatospora sp. NPDC050463]|uniref:replication-relaxation family protein n=1 Tax=Kitasatospora sp. NPDC050463 TaxID=3155786 RepID=UPI00340B1C4B
MQVLRPDAFVRLATGDTLLSWFIEVDRATESPRQLAAKCRRYRAYELTDLEYRQHGVSPGVVFVVPTEHRADRIRRVIASQPLDARGLFWVATKAEAVQTLIRPKIP